MGVGTSEEYWGTSFIWFYTLANLLFAYMVAGIQPKYLDTLPKVF